MIDRLAVLREQGMASFIGNQYYRKHLTSSEVEKLLAATKGSRHEARNRCLLLLLLTFEEKLMKPHFNSCYLK